MPLDSDVAAVLSGLAKLGTRPLHTLTPAEARAQRRRVLPPNIRQVGVESSEDLVLKTSGRDIPARLYRPPNGATQPVVLFFHGGGWVLGDLDSHDSICREIAVRSQSTVLSIAYRLAPEHPFPAAVDDAWAALLWLRVHATSVGVDRDRIALYGDSAGGNLAAVTALRARDAGIELRLQQLIYPVLDCDLERDSYTRNATGFGLQRDYMAWYWRHYAPNAEIRALPEASPLRAPDLHAVAPAHIIVCEFDPLHDEGVAYARRLEAAGVRVRLTDLDGLNHGFLSFADSVRRASLVFDEIAGELKNVFE